MSTRPAWTASNVSNGLTRVPAENTSILISPPLASLMVSASRTALVCSPEPAGQSVTILNSRRPCATAGAPPEPSAAPAKRSLRRIATILG